MIDYVFRYDPRLVSVGQTPATAEDARQALIQGNRVFSEWMGRCRSRESHEEDQQYIVSCNGLDAFLDPTGSEYPIQKPFAAVLGCSDARVPTEMLFGQGFNNLFVVRVAGNVLGDAVVGTMDFSINALSESVRVLVVLGHTNCGAVKGAVDAYLDPKKLWSKANTPSLRLIFQRIFVAIRESDNNIRRIWGSDAPHLPGYREALIETSVCLNAAHVAFNLRQVVESMSRWELDVLFGVYDIKTHQVCMPVRPGQSSSLDDINLAYAPSHPREFDQIAGEIAALMRPAEVTDALADV